MANLRQYAYYIKGNKIAIVENDATPDNDPSSKDYGPDTRLSRYVSPIENISNGLQIEYTYSPTYWISDELRNMQNKFYISGWTVKDGYLTFIRSHITSTVANWTSSPFNAVGADEYILIKESTKWNGIHKIKHAGTQGLLQTHTKVHEAEIGVTGSNNIDFSAEADVDGVSLSKIVSNDNSNIFLGNIFSAGDYIVIDNGNALNCGLWEVHSAVVENNGTAESDSYIYIKNKYYVPLDIDVDNGITSVEVEVEDTTPDTNAHDNSSVFIAKAYRDHCYLISDANVMQDESFDIDISPYMGKAVVAYVKAKMAEDAGDFKLKEYFMREFKKMLEKKQSAKVSGPRFIVSGPNAIR